MAGERWAQIWREFKSGELSIDSQEVTDFFTQSKKDVNASSDVFSIGAILFECLFGEPPSQEFLD